MQKPCLWLAWKSSYSLKFSLTSYSPYRLFSAFRSILGFWKWSQMIPHTQKPGVLKKNQISSLHRSWVTPRGRPWPPTARTGCSCPSGPSEASGNGPKWFAIPKNLGVAIKIKSLACSKVELLHEELAHLLRIVDVDFRHLADVFALLHRVFCAIAETNKYFIIK